MEKSPALFSQLNSFHSWLPVVCYQKTSFQSLVTHIKQIKWQWQTRVPLVLQPTLFLEPHLHLIVEVSEQGPQLPSWHRFSHRWIMSEITHVLLTPNKLWEKCLSAQGNALPVYIFKTTEQEFKSVSLFQNLNTSQRKNKEMLQTWG